MIDMKEFKRAQVDGLAKLADVLKKSEVNFWTRAPGADMGYIEMADTPRGPHAIFDPHSKRYDIWHWGRKRPGMKYVGLSAEDAAEVLVTAYFVAKAKRIRKHSPHLSMEELMRKLRAGYQRDKSWPEYPGQRRDQ